MTLSLYIQVIFPCLPTQHPQFMKLQATQLIAQVKILAYLFFHLSYLPLIHQLGPVCSILQLYPKSTPHTLSSATFGPSQDHFWLRLPH